MPREDPITLENVTSFINQSTLLSSFYKMLVNFFSECFSIHSNLMITILMGRQPLSDETSHAFQRFKDNFLFIRIIYEQEPIL